MTLRDTLMDIARSGAGHSKAETLRHYQGVLEEVRAATEAPEPECDHEWEWISDWYGDPNVINGTADCSGWECKKCGSTDCEDGPPESDPDFDYREGY